MNDLEKEVIKQSDKRNIINGLKNSIRRTDIKVDDTPYRDYYLWFILIVFLLFIFRNC